MLKQLQTELETQLADQVLGYETINNQLTVTLPAETILASAKIIRDQLGFAQLIDICGVDYCHYAGSAWQTKAASETGFSRAVDNSSHAETVTEGYRFAVVYHLLSINHNQRLRLKVRLDAAEPIIDSVVSIWQSADWFEREAFDLFGIIFNGHQDLRRILTDYGFVGHPLRKDFPLMGNVEMRYDPEQKRVIYELVSIEERTLVPRVIRENNHHQNSDR